MWCKTCGYVLDGLSENRCPECGHKFDPANPATILTSLGGTFWRRKRVRFVGGMALLLIFYFFVYRMLVVPTLVPFQTVLLAKYRVGGKVSEVFFAPACWLDRRWNSNAWESPYLSIFW
jgi:hypothetical protein